VRLALEYRRRVKEQQKKFGSAEFRNTQFSYTLGNDGVEKFVVTPELPSEDHVGRDPLPPGQVWGISPGGQDGRTRPRRDILWLTFARRDSRWSAPVQAFVTSRYRRSASAQSMNFRNFSTYSAFLFW
jgi:hypothetical protein